jgi:hypothetical protein
MRTLAMPQTAEPWSLTSLREKLIKIGAKVVSHGRYVTFQMAEVAVLRPTFADIPSLIARLRAPPPAPAWAVGDHAASGEMRGLWPRAQISAMQPFDALDQRLQARLTRC